MHFADLFKSTTRWKCFVYSTFAAVCLAQSVPGTRGGQPDFSSQLRSTTVTTLTSTGINYVQGNYATPQAPQTTVSVTFTGAQASADLNVVVVGWNDSTALVNTITDRSGNTYTRAVGPTVQSDSLSQSIYYAKNIAAAGAGANIVTVTFSVAAHSPDIRILEYSGADLNSPVDASVGRTGSGTTSSSGSVITTNPTDLLFAANIVGTFTASAGRGFTSRMITSPNGDIVEDRMAKATGSHSATATLNSAGPWVMQMVAFRTPTAGAPTPPTAPTNLTATVSGSQINLSWTASTDNVGVTGYLMDRCLGAGCTTFAQIATPTATTYSDTGLTPGSYSYRVRATDAAGNLSPYSNVASATIAIVAAPPAITSAITASGRVRSAFSYQITATNAPTSYGAAGLPAGLSVNAGTGLISGTPASAATSTVTLSATNSAGTGNATLMLTIAAAPPAITSATTASGRVGSAFSYQITATNTPTGYGAAGLPAGLAVNIGTGLISGTPTSAATSTVTLSATNSAGTGNATLTLTIAGAAPAITSATTASGRVGSVFSYQITATNAPTGYGATGLPPGLAVNNGTGLISGTPTSAATSTVTLSATNSAGTGNATLTLTIAGAAPSITSATTASGRVGTAFSYQITATNTPTSYGATGLPAGLSVTTGTGLISGTPTSVATSTVTLSATNSAGTGNSTLTLTVTSTGLLSLTPSSINFGNVALGSDAIQSVVLNNTSASSITISQANVAGNEFSISGLSLPLTLATNQNSTFSVAFTPSSAGTVSGSVSLVSNATNSPTTEALSGTGIHVVDLSWQPSTSSVAGYNVYRGTVSGGPYAKVNSSLISGTAYADSTVQAGQTYYYVATAVDSNNDESTYSTQASAVVP
jgi:fibronectin type 3 domain-containing protein